MIGRIFNELFVDRRGLLFLAQGQEGFFVLIDGSLATDAGNPVIGVTLRERFESIIGRGGKYAKDVSAVGTGRLDRRDGGDVGEADGDAEAGRLLVFVDREEIGAKDEVGGFPRGAKDVFMLDATEDLAGLHNAVEFEAAVLIDGREGIEVDLAIAGRGHRSEMRVLRDLNGGGFDTKPLRGSGPREHLIHGVSLFFPVEEE